MNLILLSGGNGQRLWPLSNENRSRQFVPLFRNEQGGHESMVQRIYRQVRAADPAAHIVAAASKRQVSTIKNQLGPGVEVCVEPCRRDTFPAIALAAAYLADVKGLGREEPIVVCPVDTYADDGYFAALCRLSELAAAGSANLALMGVEPTGPSPRYGYILPETAAPISRVHAFKEKPGAADAARYIAKGALWNCGVFAFKLGYLLDVAHFELDFTDFADLQAHYDAQTSISFDYAVVEKEPRIAVMRYAGAWQDAGSWDTLAAVMDEPAIGRAELDPACKNTNVVNELDIPILCMGCRDLVVAASSDGILVGEKAAVAGIRPFAEKLEGEARYAEKSWGSYTVLDRQPSAATIRITLKPGLRLAYHSHQHRSEVWTVLSGQGRAVVDGREQRVWPGVVLALPVGSRHTIIADTALEVIEIQLGASLSAADKQKFEL